MFKQSVAVDAAQLFPSPSGKGPIRFLLLGCLLLLLRLPHLSAQTSISGTQIRNPITPVAALPSTCTPYSTFYLTTTNTAYICTATNIFTPLATGTGGSGLPGPTGTPGYLFSNGTTVSWGNLLTGGSGALDCVSTPGRCDVTSIVPLKNAANTWTGANDFHAALVRLPESTVSGLPPASGNTGREFMVTDGASTCDTTMGGGSTRVLVQSTGASYVAPNCSTGGGGGGGASSTSQLTDFAITIANRTMTIQPGRIRFSASMSGGCLVIQGPPGTGKTYTAARMIRGLLAGGKKVGVVSNSHKAVTHLLEACGEALREAGARLTGIKVGSDGNGALFDDNPDFRHVEKAADAKDAYSAGVVGGTAWLFCRPEWEDVLDFLFVDEAGQVSLANTVAMTRCTRNLVLLGDQMQLEQPIQGVHPGDSGLSGLQYA